MGQAFGHLLQFENSSYIPPETIAKGTILHHGTCPKCISDGCIQSVANNDNVARWFGVGGLGKYNSLFIVNEKSRSRKDPNYTGDCIHDGALLLTYRVHTEINAIGNATDIESATRNKKGVFYEAVSIQPPKGSLQPGECDLAIDQIFYEWNKHPFLEPFKGIFRFADNMIFFRSPLEKKIELRPFRDYELILAPGWKKYMVLESACYVHTSRLNEYVDRVMAEITKDCLARIRKEYEDFQWEYIVSSSVLRDPPDGTEDSLFRQYTLNNTVLGGWSGLFR